MTDGPVYIGVLSYRSAYIPIEVGVIEKDGKFAVGFRQINGRTKTPELYRFGDQVIIYDTEAEARDTLEMLAVWKGWKPYQKLRRF